MNSVELEYLNIVLTYLELFGLVLAYCGARKYTWVDSFEEYFVSLTKFKFKDYLEQWPYVLFTAVAVFIASLFTGLSWVAMLEGAFIISLLAVVAFIVRCFIWFSKGSFVTTLGVVLAVPSVTCRLFC